MLEDYLIQIGMRCGTVKNFSSTIANDMRQGNKQHWYFLTPIKTTDEPNGLKTSIVNLAFPFIAKREDISEAVVYKRLTPFIAEYEKELLKGVRQLLTKTIVKEFIPIAFWANETGERTERKNLGAGSIHIFKVQLQIKWRANNLNCLCKNK